MMNETDEITEMDAPRGAAPDEDGQRMTSEEFELVFAVHQNLIREIDLEAVEKLAPEEAREAVEVTARTLLGQIAPSVYGENEERIVRRVLNEAIGLGPIEPLLEDASISEVMVNAPDEVYYERDGVIYLSDVRFRDKVHIMRIIDRIISPLGRRVDEQSPFVDARLPDGSRVNVIIPPLVPKSPILTIRKFRPDRYTIEDLVGNDTLTQQLGGLPPGVCPPADEPGHLGRRRHRQDHAAQCRLGLHPEQRADRHHRRPDRAEASAEPRRSAWRRGRPTSRARTRSSSATSSGTPSACVLTGSSSARCAARRRST